MLVQDWLETLTRPEHMADAEYRAFMRYAAQFFYDLGRLWRKDPQGAHKRVIMPSDRIAVLQSAHDGNGHHGIFATKALLMERFWWPGLPADVAWFVKTCHECQTYQVRQVRLSPTVAYPAALFIKVYADTMHMPKSGAYRYIVQARCALSHYPEWRMLQAERGPAIADWIFQDILCRWGTISEIVTDNGTPFLAALDTLAGKYHVHHIRISGYNSKANGIVERSHFDVRQALIKAAEKDPQTEKVHWARAAYAVFWSERITPRRRMGCSPYFVVTGTHPIMPMDIGEANYLLPPPERMLSTTELIARRAVALQKRGEDLERIRSKVYEARVRAAVAFEQAHEHTIRDFAFEPGDLVLLRNSAIDKVLNRKTKPRYMGPMITVTRTKGGAYVLADLDGTVLHRPVAAFRVIPYLARKQIELPRHLLDVTPERLREMAEATDAGEGGEEEEMEQDVC